jgi:hyperosmotically inducible periplasmic protein
MAARHMLSLLAMTRTSAKVSALITCLSALPLMIGLTGCAGDRHNQSTDRRTDDHRTAERGYKQNSDQLIEDSRTAERVREALAAGADYKYDGAKVIASKGVVQLSGFVNTSAQRNRAGEVASNVVGVNSVENNLTVKE